MKSESVIPNLNEPYKYDSELVYPYIQQHKQKNEGYKAVPDQAELSFMNSYHDSFFETINTRHKRLIDS